MVTDNAVQKYVLVQVKHMGEERFFVRGDADAAYHKDAVRPFVTHLRSLNVPYTVLGGGRIDHNTAMKSIKIFGFSYGFPWQSEPMHEVAAKQLQKDYPGFAVSTSNDGY